MAQLSPVRTEGPYRLLLVEDEKITALDLRATLIELGYDVVGVASSCKEALERAALDQPDLVLMDIRLSGSDDGIKTAAMLRARQQVPIVYLTANANSATLARALETEPGGYLHKPYDPRSLHTTIQLALRRHAAEHSRREAHSGERRRHEQRSNELVALAEQLSDEANTDALTSLYNRRFFDHFMTERLQVAQRDHEPFAVILLDLDHFKQLNDQHGHLAGDAVLREVGAALRRGLRERDVACRYGGEEVVVVAPGASLTDACQLAERLRTDISGLTVNCDSGPLTFTASFGVAAFPEHGLAAAALLNAADSALYRAKRCGRNSVVPARL